MRKQHLNLFFTRDDTEQSINNNILRKYMNRFIIDEYNQSEIIGVFYFQNRDPGKQFRIFSWLHLD